MSEAEKLNKINTKKDLETLDKLYTDVLNLNFNNSNLYILTDKLTDMINKEVTNLMEKGNISYNEYKKITEDTKFQKIEEESYHKLGQDRLDNLFESCTTKEIVETLSNMELDKDFIIGTFAESDRALEASRVYSEINEIPFIYENKENDIKVTKDDLNFIYGDKIEILNEKQLEILAEKLVENYIPNKEYYFDSSDFSYFVTEYKPIEEELKIIEDQEKNLDKAKKLIEDFCLREYDTTEDCDFSNLHRVYLAYTTTEDEKHTINVVADLIDCKLDTYLDNKQIESLQYESLNNFIQEELEHLSFDDLVFLKDDIEETEEDEL